MQSVWLCWAGGRRYLFVQKGVVVAALGWLADTPTRVEIEVHFTFKSRRVNNKDWTQFLSTHSLISYISSQSLLASRESALSISQSVLVLCGLTIECAPCKNK